MGKHRIQNMEELGLFPVLGVVDAMGGLDWEGSMLGFCSMLVLSFASTCTSQGW